MPAVPPHRAVRALTALRTTVLCLLLVPSMPLPAADTQSAAHGLLAGHWRLDTAASDDVEEAFDGKLRRSRFPVPSVLREGEPPASQDLQQMNYWDAVREQREKRSMKDLARLGTVFPLLTATQLDIEPGTNGYTFTYDELLPRRVQPNPAGRVYSASGDELVSDTIGYTLAWWDGDSLVLETDPPDGGHYTERVTPLADPPRLEYRVKVELVILEEPVEVERVFVPAGTAP